MTPQIEPLYRKCLQSVAPAENARMLKTGKVAGVSSYVGSRGKVTSVAQSTENAKRCRALKAEGYTLREIAAETDFSYGMVKHYCSKKWSHV
jgi:hypothetical protein